MLITPQHSAELENIEVLTTELRWFERGVNEALRGHIHQSPQPLALNREGQRYNLPPVWDIIKKKVKADRPRHLAQRPIQHDLDVLQTSAKGLVS